MSEYLELIKNKNFNKYLTARVISKFGDIVYTLSIMWYILDKTGSSATVGFLLAFSNLPQIVTGLFCGVIVDKFSKKNIMIFSDLIRSVLIIVILIILKSSSFSIWPIFICSFLLEMFDIVFGTARSAILPSIVDDENIIKANILIETIFNVLDVVGMALGGILIAVTSMNTLFIVNSVTFILSAFFIGLIKINKNRETKDIECDKESSFFMDLKEGVSYVYKNKFIKVFIVVLLITNLAYGLLDTLPVILSQNVLHVGSEGMGFIRTSIAIGMVIGSLIIGMLKVKSPGKYYFIGLLFSGLSVLIIGGISNFPAIVILYFLYGASDSITSPIFSYLQIIVDKNIIGRVFSIINVIGLILAPISMGLSGILCDMIGVQPVYIMGGVLLICSAFIVLISKSMRKAYIK